MVVPAAVKQAEAEAEEALSAYEQAQKETQEDNSSALDGVGLDSTEQEQLTASEEDRGETGSAAGETDGDQSASEEGSGDNEVSTGVDWQQKYKSLQGKYNAEIPRLQAELAETNRRVMDLLASRVTAGAGADSAAAARAPKGPVHARYLKKEEVDDYGEEILDMQARMAKGVAEGVLEEKISPYMQRIEYLESLLVNNSSQSFWDKVENEVPGAQEMNDSDPLWHEFLEGVDDGSGLTYGEIGERAYDAGDASRLVRLFKQYLSQGAEGDGSPPQENKPKPPVKPGKVGSKPPAKAPLKPTFKESEVRKFFDDKAVGKYRGKEKEAAAKEKAIDEAFVEGRIVAG